jgi:RNA polymerase sigma factor (sigma-70 family)
MRDKKYRVMIKNSLLTKEIAKKFLKNKYLVDLETFTDIEDAAADILAGHKGGLSLSALKNLSETAASFLALVEPILASLNARERRVLALRFGLGDGNALSPEEIGKALQVSQAQIRMIEAKAIRKLRHPKNVLILGALDKNMNPP